MRALVRFREAGSSVTIPPYPERGITPLLDNWCSASPGWRQLQLRGQQAGMQPGPGRRRAVCPAYQPGPGHSRARRRPSPSRGLRHPKG